MTYEEALGWVIDAARARQVEWRDAWFVGPGTCSAIAEAGDHERKNMAHKLQDAIEIVERGPLGREIETQ